MRRNCLIVLYVAIFASAAAFPFSNAFAQENGLNSGSIKSQFDYIKEVSTNYQDYKVVKRNQLDQLEANITDSISAYQQQIAEIKKSLGEQKSNIVGLNEEISRTNEALEEAISQKDSFYFFGTYVHKNLYNNLMWGRVIVLGLVLVISYIRFKRSHVITAETKKRLDEVQEEYDQHRKNTLERERKLNRQLVDALNKK
jgi:septal ring factor EnvC (AmiA/AmiB activator)